MQRPSKWRKSVLFSNCLENLPAIQLGELSAPAPLLLMFHGLVARSGLGKEPVSTEIDRTPGTYPFLHLETNSNTKKLLEILMAVLIFRKSCRPSDL